MHFISRVPLAGFDGLFSGSNCVSDELRAPLGICGCGTNGVNHKRMCCDALPLCSRNGKLLHIFRKLQ
jgi:hypothetical protein